MQKVKCEQPTGAPDKCASSGSLGATASSSASLEQPARKRHKALNFSIASIMQSADEDEDHRNTNSPPLYLSEQQIVRQQQMFAAAAAAGELAADRKKRTGCDSQRAPSASPSNLSTASDNSSGSDDSRSAKWLNMRAADLLDSNARNSSTSSAGSAGSASAQTNVGASTKQQAGTSSSGLVNGIGSNGNGTSSNASSRLSQVECQLDNKDMWDKFHSLNTEMIITKTGRRMFPVMKVQFHNLDPNARYAVTMDIVPVDNKRYRYAYHKSCWQVAGKADPSAEPRLYPHPDSPFNGDLLSRQVISFEKVKLTNNEMDKSGHIILNSMHKYQPRVHLLELKLPQTSSHHHQTTSKSFTSLSDHHHQHNNNNNHHHHHHHNHHRQQHNNNNHHQQQTQPHLDIEDYKTFVFPETVFTAVTAYQNQLITKMKIDKNPFAKGFRDSSRLSDLDRNDPFDYMGSLGPGGRGFVGQPGAPGSLEAAAQAAGMGAQMDAYQLLASAANNPWYSAVAAATGGGSNPFANPMGAAAAACSTVQASQLQAQMWLAAFSAAFSGGGAGAGGGGAPNSSTPAGLGNVSLPPIPRPMIGDSRPEKQQIESEEDSSDI